MEGLQYYLIPRDDTYSWIDRFIAIMGNQAFSDYESKVYAALGQLKPGRHYNITKDVPQEQQELFIKMCHYYSIQHPEIDFNIEVTKVINYGKP